MSGIKSYILDDEVKITILNGKINIVNYIDIVSFESTKVIIKCDNKTVIINGKNLVISKLVHDEVLITGSINLIEFR